MGLFGQLFGRKSSTARKDLTRGQMDLLWMDRSGLAVMKASLTNPDVAVVGADGAGGVRDQKKDITVEDISWAEGVMTIAEQAGAASKREDYAKAIKLYKQALQQAPECDLYLMSIGSCFANMGKPREGVSYLERAAKVNPNNARIQNNLAVLRQMLRG